MTIYCFGANHNNYADFDGPKWKFWIDSFNSLLQDGGPYLTPVGEAYNKPWHLDEYNPY